MAIDDAAPDLITKTCTVLGGRTFVGRSLVSRLLQLGNWIVRIADSAPSLRLESGEENSILSDAIISGRASFVQVDVREKRQIFQAIRGSAVVFFMDSLDSRDHDFYLNYMWIVQGAKNVIKACKECNVEKLIYNSSADVVCGGGQSVQNGDESLHCSGKLGDVLSELKAQAESLVLFSNGSGELLTCALRPSNIFGPGDPYLVPFLVERAKSVWAKFIVGNGENMSDFTYVENVAHAHICAELALHSGNNCVAGKAFFITNLEPLKYWEFISLILEGLGYERPKIRVPVKLIWFLVAVDTFIQEKLKRQRNKNSQLHPALVKQISSTRTFNCSNAQQSIGYSPIVNLEEGVALTIESFSQLAEDSPYLKSQDLSQPSKAEKLLGNGKVAEMLLWRDQKKTFTCALSVLLLFHWIFVSGRTFISSTALLLLLLLVIIFIRSILSSSTFGYNFAPSAKFEVSESVIKYVFVSLASLWNTSVVPSLKLLAQGNDFNHFLKVFSSVYVFKMLLSFSPTLLIGLGLLFMFTSLYVYEQYEDQANRLEKATMVGMEKLKVSLMRSSPVSLQLFLRQYCIPAHDGAS
ncbi:3beta-hydroxysteroid-dehydrogenase/decarboxylase isoform X2 [Aristolochia californica]|uniref:3beta-hydroxysteroid-dehydrogenase/decarboxylase isoform X2 n=1 Tax=Aristolochia californica TaxID=171875 RepID=UPI0035D7485C